MHDIVLKEKDSLIYKLGFLIVIFMPLIAVFNYIPIYSFGQLTIRGTDIIFILAYLLIINTVVLEGKIPTPVLVILALIMLIFVFSIFLESYTEVNKNKLAQDFRFYQTVLWGGIGYFYINSERKFNVFLTSIILSLSVMSCFSIYQYITMPGLHRVAGFFSYANASGLINTSGINGFNEIGALFSLSLLCILYKYKNFSHNKHLIIYILAFFLNLIGLVLTQSRSAILAFVLLIILGGLFSSIKIAKNNVFVKKYIVKSSIILIVLVFITVSLILPRLNLNRIYVTFDPGSSANISMVTRLSTWENGYKTWMQSEWPFLFGYGSGAAESQSTTENFFLDSLNIRGLIGTSIVLFLFLYPLFLCRGKNKEIKIITIFLAILVSLTGNVLVDPYYGGVTFIILYSGGINQYYLSGELKSDENNYSSSDF